MTDQTEKLKALALAAGGREWIDNGTRIQERREAGEPPSDERLVWRHSALGRAKPEHIAHIAAANPAAVLELIAEVERLREEKEAPDSHVIPPPRGTGSQQEACDALLSACRKGVAALAHAADNPMYMEAYGALSSAIEADVARRGRAQGGNTSENSGLLEDPKTAETRIGSSFEGGHLGSAPAAGTDKDAERYRWLRERMVEFSTGWYVGTFSKEDMDKAIDTAIGEHREPT